MIQVHAKGRNFWHLINAKTGKVVGFACHYKVAIAKAVAMSNGVGYGK